MGSTGGFALMLPLETVVARFFRNLFVLFCYVKQLCKLFLNMYAVLDNINCLECAFVSLASLKA